MIDLNKLLNCESHYPENFTYRIQNEFWKDTSKYVIEFCKKKDPFKDQLLLQYPLFYNPDITMGNKRAFFKSWFEKGVHFIINIETFTFYSYDEFCKAYGFHPNYRLFLVLITLWQGT